MGKPPKALVVNQSVTHDVFAFLFIIYATFRCTMTLQFHALCNSVNDRLSSSKTSISLSLSPSILVSLLVSPVSCKCIPFNLDATWQRPIIRNCMQVVGTGVLIKRHIFCLYYWHTHWVSQSDRAMVATCESLRATHEVNLKPIKIFTLERRCKTTQPSEIWPLDLEIYKEKY